jgi:hypothetical protein
MISEKQLVEYHVLAPQNAVVSSLMEANKIDDDAIIYDSDIMEWWLITPTLARWLRRENEFVLEDLGCFWWGRQCSGQAIYMDSVISDIVKGFNLN